MTQLPIVPFLASPGPHPDLATADQIFAPFVGSWDLDVAWFADGAIVRQDRGEWHFAWVLEGRAIQDVWIVPRRSERTTGNAPYEYGTSIRFYDDTLKAWRSTWIGPIQRRVHTFLAFKKGDDVILETTPGSADEMRWVFTDIAEHSFSWRNYAKKGKDWILDQQFSATRWSTTASSVLT